MNTYEERIGTTTSHIVYCIGWKSYARILIHQISTNIEFCSFKFVKSAHKMESNATNNKNYPLKILSDFRFMNGSVTDTLLFLENVI